MQKPKKIILERVTISEGSAKTLIRVKASNGQEITLTQTILENIVWANHGDTFAKQWVLETIVRD